MKLKPKIIYVKFALYRIILFQPFNVVEQPNKFYCFYIYQQATNEKGQIFLKTSMVTSFSKGLIDQPIINCYYKIYARIVLKNGKNQNNLKFTK